MGLMDPECGDRDPPGSAGRILPLPGPGLEAATCDTLENSWGVHGCLSSPSRSIRSPDDSPIDRVHVCAWVGGLQRLDLGGEVLVGDRDPRVAEKRHGKTPNCLTRVCRPLEGVSLPKR